MNLAALDAPVRTRLGRLHRDRVVQRIWARDTTVWAEDPRTPELADRLGWLLLPETMRVEMERVRAFAGEVRGETDRLVLCGMGGSSLAPEVVWRAFGRREGYPALHLLDSTHPGPVAAAESPSGLYLISSKSGTTIETASFARYFWEKSGNNGSRFSAVTDPGTVLEREGNDKGFRRIFTNPPDVGGRFSALSLFGLVPAAVIGVDPEGLLDAADSMTAELRRPAEENPGAWLGAFMGEGARVGRDKLTFVLSPSLMAFGLWLEQLIAESTGKEGRGVLPVVEEYLGPPEVYGEDRIFVWIAREDERDDATAAAIDALGSAGHPVVSFVLNDARELGAEFLRWEFATAVAGALLHVNPFDQPNVAESKANTSRVLASGEPPLPAASADELAGFLAGVQPGDYLALLAFVPPSKANDRRLGVLQRRLRDRLAVAVTVGYGPRFLHSTGQLHKGGRPTGHFLQIVDWGENDVPVPGEGFTFGALIAAQADGDLEALRARGRPALRLNGWDLLEREAG